jgi:hypothetical protein
MVALIPRQVSADMVPFARRMVIVLKIFSAAKVFSDLGIPENVISSLKFTVNEYQPQYILGYTI